MHSVEGADNLLVFSGSQWTR